MVAQLNIASLKQKKKDLLKQQEDLINLENSGEAATKEIFSEITK